MNENLYIAHKKLPHKTLRVHSARYTQCIHVSSRKLKLSKDTHAKKCVCVRVRVRVRACCDEYARETLKTKSSSTDKELKGNAYVIQPLFFCQQRVNSLQRCHPHPPHHQPPNPPTPPHPTPPHTPPLQIHFVGLYCLHVCYRNIRYVCFTVTVTRANVTGVRNETAHKPFGTRLCV